MSRLRQRSFPPGLRHVGRIGVTSLDQVLSSASNLIFVLLLAHVADIHAFASFSISWVVLVLLVALVRGALSVHISMSANDTAEVRAQARHALGLIVLLSPAVLAVMLLAPLVSLRYSAWPAALLSVFAPIVLMQDILRFERFAAGEPRRALLADGVWVIAIGTGIAVEATVGISPALVVILWGVGAALSLFVIMDGELRPQVSGLRDWMKGLGPNRTQFATSSIMGAAGVALASMLVAQLTDATVVAALAGASQLMAPINTLIAVMGIWVLPRSMSRSPKQRVQLFALAGVFLSLGTLTWTFLLNQVPTDWGETLLGSTWGIAQPVLFFVGLQFSIGCFAISAGGALTSLRLGRLVLIESVVLGLGRVAWAGTMAASIGTAVAVALGEALALAGAGALGWYLAIHWLRRRNHLS